MGRGRVTIGRRRSTDLADDPNQIVVVSTKALWSDARWLIRPYLYPVNAAFALPPTISSATLTYEYGNVLRPGYTTTVASDPIDILDHYVKIEIFSIMPDPDQPTRRLPLGVWHGIIVQEDRLPDAAADFASKGGRQVFRAHGLEHLLRKVPVDASVAYTDQLILRRNAIPLIFNCSRLSGQRIPNMTDILGATAPTFWPTGTLKEWDLGAMAQYFLTWFANDRLAMAFRVGTLPEGLATIKPMYAPFGKTIFTCLSELFCASRGLGWRVEVGEWRPPADDPDAEVQADIVELHVHTSLTETVTIGDIVMPLNPLRLPRPLDAEVRIPGGGLRIIESTVPRYKTVRIQGRPIVVMCTVGYYDGTLEPDWSAADETAYKAAASGAAGYSARSFAEQAAINDEYRASRDGLSTVYLRHRINREWDFKTARYKPYPPHDRRTIVPFADGNGNIIWGHSPSVAPLRRQKRLLDWLPIRRGMDYTTSPPGSPEGLADEYRRPMVFSYATCNGRDWRLFELADLPPGYPRAAVRLMSGEMGFELRPSGAVPHRFALRRDPTRPGGSWFDVDIAEPTMQPPIPTTSLDYRELLATVAMELEVRPYVEFSPAVFVDNDETLILSLDWIEYWAATEQAIIGVSNTTYESLVLPVYIHPDERVLRDDTPQLRAVAAFARQWYSVERRLVDLTIRRLENFPVGALLQAVTYGNRLEQVNTVVSLVMWDFERRTTRIMTSHRELDLNVLFGAQPLGGG